MTSLMLSRPSRDPCHLICPHCREPVLSGLDGVGQASTAAVCMVCGNRRPTLAEAPPLPVRRISF